MTQQQEERKEALADSLRDLLKHEAIEKVTVDQICQEAKVHRSTFYRYFTDKYDLMYYSFERLMIARIDENNVIDSIIEIIVNDKELFRNVSINNNNGTLFWMMVKMLSCQLLKADEEGRLHSIGWVQRAIESSTNKELTAKMISGACLTLMFEWIDSNYQMSPKELSGFVKNMKHL